jgi:hypothetical protein
MSALLSWVWSPRNSIRNIVRFLVQRRIRNKNLTLLGKLPDLPRTHIPGQGLETLRMLLLWSEQALKHWKDSLIALCHVGCWVNFVMKEEHFGSRCQSHTWSYVILDTSVNVHDLVQMLCLAVPTWIERKQHTRILHVRQVA